MTLLARSRHRWSTVQWPFAADVVPRVGIDLVFVALELQSAVAHSLSILSMDREPIGCAPLESEKALR